MLAKLTSKTRLTLPKALLTSCPDARYFEVTKEQGGIVLTTARIGRADAVRAKLAEPGIEDSNVADAVQWPQPSLFPS